MLSLEHVDDREELALSADGDWAAYTVHDNRTQARVGDADEDGLLPSGNLVGYVDCDIWVTNTVTSETRNLTRGVSSSWGASWSPDGTRLAFYSDRDGALRVWVWERTSGLVRRVSDARVQVTWGGRLQWTPDGRALVIATRSGSGVRQSLATPPLDSGGSPRVYRFSGHPGAASANATRDTVGSRQPKTDLVLLDVRRGIETRLVQGERVVGWWLSRDGRTLAFALDRGTIPPAPESPVTYLRDVVTLDLASGRRTVVGVDVKVFGGNGPLVTFSPDGRALSYTSQEFGQRGGDCFVSFVNQPARNVTPGPHESFGHSSMGPVWGRSARDLYLVGASELWRIRLGTPGERDTLSRVIAVAGAQIRSVVTTPDHFQSWMPDSSNSLVVVTRDTATLGVGLYRIDLDRGTAVPWYHANQEIEGPWFSRPRIVGSSTHGRLVFVAEDLRHPADLWLGSSFGPPRQLTHLNSSISPSTLSGGRVIEWRDSLGRVLRGVLMLPLGYDQGRRYPLVVFQYPTELKSANANRFGGDAAAGLLNMHLLTTRGYAVLLPDVPALRDGADTTVMRAAWRAVAGGVDRAVALGVADPDRLGIIGHSFGAYGVLGTIIATPRFRAAVALSGGSYDFAAQFLQLQPDGGSIYTKTGVYELGGSLWERPAAYVANSPVFFLDRVTTPLLLVAGGADVFATPAQSAQVFVGLRTLGREVEYVVYPAEGHIYLFWTRAHQEDVVNRIIEWFDLHLKGPK